MGALRHWRLVHSDCTVSANLTSSDALTAVTEDIAGDQIDPAHDEDDDASRDHHAPESKAERFLAEGFLVEVAEHVDTEHDHCKCQSDEAVSRTEQRPVASVEATEEREFGKQEEHYVMVSKVHVCLHSGNTYCL